MDFVFEIITPEAFVDNVSIVSYIVLLTAALHTLESKLQCFEFGCSISGM